MVDHFQVIADHQFDRKEIRIGGGEWHGTHDLLHSHYVAALPHGIIPYAC